MNYERFTKRLGCNSENRLGKICGKIFEKEQIRWQFASTSSLANVTYLRQHLIQN